MRMEKRMSEKPLSPIEELIKKTGRSKTTIYRYAQKLGRLPTVEELNKQKKSGRPRKYE